MDEKRKFDRWGSLREKSFVTIQGQREEMEVVDVSVGGMRVVAQSAGPHEGLVSGELKILPGVGAFFVKGKVVWSQKREHDCELGIQFEQVSALPLS